jgi:hypothetical protein
MYSEVYMLEEKTVQATMLTPCSSFGIERKEARNV